MKRVIIKICPRCQEVHSINQEKCQNCGCYLKCIYGKEKEVGNEREEPL